MAGILHPARFLGSSVQQQPLYPTTCGLVRFILHLRRAWVVSLANMNNAVNLCVCSAWIYLSHSSSWVPLGGGTSRFHCRPTANTRESHHSCLEQLHRLTRSWQHPGVPGRGFIHGTTRLTWGCLHPRQHPLLLVLSGSAILVGVNWQFPVVLFAFSLVKLVLSTSSSALWPFLYLWGNTSQVICPFRLGFCLSVAELCLSPPGLP